MQSERRRSVTATAPSTTVMTRDFVEFAKARGVMLIGIRMPETRGFREASRAMMDPALEQFAPSLGINLLDYREAYAARPELFFDADHLTDQGAAVLSQQVAADIRQLLGLPIGEPWICSSGRLLDTDPARTFEWLLKH